MENKKKADNVTRRKIVAILAVFFCLVTAAFAVWYLKGTHDQTPVDIENALTITNLQAGKADAAVICFKDVTSMVDTGLEEDYELIDEWLKSHDRTKIDFMILTHFDRDHIGSAVKILQNYPVAAVYYPDYVSTKEYYAPLMEELAVPREGRKAVAVDEKMSFDIDEVKIELFPADDPEEIFETGNKVDNNMSLMSMISFGSKKFLFTGDVEKERLSQLVESSDDHSADWMTFPHHGAYEKHEKDFISKVAPRYGVISTGYEREPDEKLTEYLDKKKISFLTTLDGNVTTICDGKSLTMSMQ